MQNEIYETSDGFIWTIIDSEKVKEIFNNRELEIFSLNEDESETLMEDEESIDEEINFGSKFGTSIGYKSELKKEFKEGEQNRFRNKDFRSFDEWLNDRINVILE